MEDGSAVNTHALVELASSCRSEYDSFGVLEVNREGDPVFADSSSEKTLDALNGFHIATEGSIAISLIALRIRCLSPSRESIDFLQCLSTLTSSTTGAG